MYESNCLLHMSRNGVPFQGPLVCDASIQRFSRDDKRNQPDEWYFAYTGLLYSGQYYLYCSYGSWSEGSEFEYKSWEDSSQGISYSATERKELQAKIEANRRLVLIEQKKRHEEAAEKAKTIWETSSSVGSHPYLKEKGVQAYGVRFKDHSLLISLKNMEGKITSLQFIYQENGKFLKRFLTGGERRGCFHLIGEIQADSLICVAEGYATGASWHEATLFPTVIAFDSGNLSAVIQALRSRYLTNQILIVGDDDVEAKVNVGRQKAIHAAKTNNCLCIFPEFKGKRHDSMGKAFTDFNDLHVSYGLEEIQIQFKAMMVQQETTQTYQSFKDLDKLIDQTTAFEDLTGYIWQAFSANKKHLKASEIKRLSKKIANKAGISVKDLEQDEGDNHRSIALSVIGSFGHQNLIES